MAVLKDNRATVQKVLWITLLLNILVMAIKAGVGLRIGALSLQADALHSVTDSANNVLGLVAMRFSSPYPDRDHPYGHLKYEAIGALAIAAFLGIACFEILQGGIMRIIKGGKPVEIAGPELWLLIIVLGVNIFVTYYERSVGQRVGSAILIADARHTMSDVWVTITVLLGLVGVWVGNTANIPQLQWLDVILSFPVAFLVFSSGWKVLMENLPLLVDEMAIAPEVIHQIVMEVPGVLNCHAIASRGVVGRQVFIEMHLVVSAQDVETAHRITEAVEARLTQQFSPVRILIHVEPPDYRSDQITFEQEL
ncbi:ferrous-iron efflux pump FieF [Microcystis aeruginosa NIES-2519]|uniref:Ferrous-iron efflux pump FieF n=2 Tax=Microcystis aeruginosa TaxID=1126 RepID=A0A5A5R471_MICAE|nr:MULTISPECIES: cation diffusion facilitator family transporter [Microcystis]AVQ73081.1 cation-efflux pump [Microcystis sp. MC19]CCI30728.1 Genome sequencing data, contig C267 [Microcystis sp. T1-4]GCA71094.1 ferrous-iron efflux pump FieF [Microcystis aeruginosa NIES-2519]GCA82826.1 ferrous-iron efflux pump FieF [Microcystis aeruginosa NIES-2522]GCA87262.1 ferrouS-iron efflux pump FieF [Microcystis aeruginosa NIES-4264]